MANSEHKSLTDWDAVSLIDEATKNEILARFEIGENDSTALYKLCCVIHALEKPQSKLKSNITS